MPFQLFIAINHCIDSHDEPEFILNVLMPEYEWQISQDVNIFYTLDQNQMYHSWRLPKENLDKMHSENSDFLMGTYYSTKNLGISQIKVCSSFVLNVFSDQSRYPTRSALDRTQTPPKTAPFSRVRAYNLPTTRKSLISKFEEILTP